MLVRVIEYLKLKRKSKRFMFSFVVFMLSIITGFSYAIFMISTDKYRVSEMFIANLMYGINISDSDNTSSISGKEVTVGVGTTEIINVTLTSLNPVDSNYKLQYKILSGTGDVYYSDRTNWMPYGSISKSNEGVYVKTIKIVIENTGTGSLTVEIGASGGYAYNSVNSVALISGYTAITEEKTTVVAIGDGELLKELVEKDTSCDTTESGVCLYGGESKNNYVQYPESSNKSENISRIMGLYNDGGKVLAKMIGETSTTSSYTNAVPNLNSFYNDLEYVSDYILPTNKFLCTGSNISCAASSKFSNIGLINVDEYNKIGGINSYLGSTSSYFSMTEANSLVSNITSSGIEDVSFSTTSGLRPTIYLQGDLKVTGTGKVDDPYIIVPPAYNVTIIWRLNGEEQSGNLPLKGKGYKVESVTCDKGAKGYWDTNAWELKVENLTADSTCIIDFKYDKPLYAQVLEDNPNVSTRSSFSTIFTTSNNGNTIYRATGQDGKTTYYFAGTVTNNYVKFANKYWRIVRINEDNSVRLIYAGASATDTAAFISTSQAYNSSYNNSSYVGYMYTASEQYGTNTNSPIKTVVDNWYSSNLNSYSGYISKTAIYCNDRTVGSGTWSATGSVFYYAAFTRLNTNKTPTFACSNSNDRFTASTTTGNGKLIYPIGLITADEISYAGGLYGTNNTSYYIAQNASSGSSWWWTMSPYRWRGDYAIVFGVGGSSNTGRLIISDVVNSYGVRPVISLKACVLASGGSGTASDPYTVELADGCANVENEILEENTVRVSATTNDASMATVNAPSSVIINSGGSHTFTFTVNSGYKYESVSGCNGVFDTNTNKLTVSNVTSSTTCQVNFISNNHTVTMKGSGGTISPTSATVSHGSSKTFTVTASTGYTTTGATVSCTNGVSGSISGSTVTVSNVTSSTTCTVTLPLKTYTVSAAPNSTTYATVNSPSSVSVSHGGSHTFTFSVKTGYQYSSLSNCTGGSYNTSTNKLTVSNVTSNRSCTVNFKALSPLYAQVLEDNPNVSTRSSFSSIFTASNNGNTIYKASGQNNKTTYYFAGSVTNNYVKFANKYWRIVRINEDNSVRLIYAGTSATDTAAFISTSQAYNSSYNNSSYVGYMYTTSQQYGTNTNSPIKTVLDNWYASNLSSYSGYISKTAIYCNDRTVASGDIWSATGSAFDYAAYTRLYTNKTPTFVCSNANDKFTASTSTGNGKLTYPIGLITMDEVYYAGGYTANNTSYYIAQNASSGASYWWTMSPSGWNSSGLAYVFIVGGSSETGRLNRYGYVRSGLDVRPVISLKACVLASGGSGTASDPYTVSLADGCANVENEILEENTVRVSATTNDTSMATVNAPSSVSVSHGGSHKFTFSVKTGYEYSSLSNCTGGSYNKNTNTLTVSNVTSNRSCIVNFKAKTYTISFNARGGTGGPTTVTKTHGVTLTLPTTKPTRSGYTFVEWNTKSDGTGTAYAPGASYTGNANATLYARWLGANTYTVQATSTNAGWYDKWTSDWYNNYYAADHERVGMSSTGIPYAINILFDLEPYKNKEITKILLYIYVIDEATWQFSIDHKYNNTATGNYKSQAWATVGYNYSGVGSTKRKYVYRSDTVEGWNAIDLTEYGLPDYGYVLGPYNLNVTNYWRISRTASSGGKPYLVITVKEEV